MKSLKSFVARLLKSHLVLWTLLLAIVGPKGPYKLFMIPLMLKKNLETPLLAENRDKKSKKYEFCGVEKVQ
jgi:hypothetical protein